VIVIFLALFLLGEAKPLEMADVNLHDAIDMCADQQSTFVLTGSQYIHVFDRDGYAHTIGRPGQGPGELDHAVAISTHRRRIYVLERFSGKVSIFSTAGAFEDSFPLEIDATDAMWAGDIMVDEQGISVVFDKSPTVLIALNEHRAPGAPIKEVDPYPSHIDRQRSVLRLAGRLAVVRGLDGEITFYDRLTDSPRERVRPDSGDLAEILESIAGQPDKPAWDSITLQLFYSPFQLGDGSLWLIRAKALPGNRFRAVRWSPGRGFSAGITKVPAELGIPRWFGLGVGGCHLVDAEGELYSYSLERLSSDGTDR